MARVKRGVVAHRKHKTILERAKGFRYSRKLLAELAVRDRGSFTRLVEVARNHL